MTFCSEGKAHIFFPMNFVMRTFHDPRMIRTPSLSDYVTDEQGNGNTPEWVRSNQPPKSRKSISIGAAKAYFKTSTGTQIQKKSFDFSLYKSTERPGGRLAAISPNKFEFHVLIVNRTSKDYLCTSSLG
jgi:hypothetical protein